MHYAVGSRLSDQPSVPRGNDSGHRTKTEFVDSVETARGLMIAFSASVVCWAMILTLAWKLIH